VYSWAFGTRGNRVLTQKVPGLYRPVALSFSDPAFLISLSAPHIYGVSHRNTLGDCAVKSTKLSVLVSER